MTNVHGCSQLDSKFFYSKALGIHLPSCNRGLSRTRVQTRSIHFVQLFEALQQFQGIFNHLTLQVLALRVAVEANIFLQRLKVVVVEMVGQKVVRTVGIEYHCDRLK